MDLTIRVIHEWRPGHADPLACIEEGIALMTDIAARLLASVDGLALALGNQSAAIGEVATAIRNHPSSTVDNGALSALADRLDGITASVTSSVEQLQGLAGEENIEDAGSGSEPSEPPISQPPETSGDAGSGEQPGTDTSLPPAEGAEDVGSAGAGQADTASGDGFPPENNE